MLPFRHIVFPVDFSPPCELIVPYVKELARRFSCGLTLVHASGLGLEALGYTELTIADPEWEAQSRAFEEKRLKDFAREALAGQHVELILEAGDPAAVIHKVVQRQGADLVMLPTHGRGTLRRFLLGSVTAKVLHDVSAAVWTSAHHALAEHAPSIPYKSILCAIEGPDEGPAVVKAAAMLARCYQAQLTLVHAVETPMGSSDLDFGPYKKEIMESADHWMQEMKWSLGVDAPHLVIDAGAPSGIRQEAIARKADLIVAGRGHAQSTFGALWSRLYAIIGESPCPVLSI